MGFVSPLQAGYNFIILFYFYIFLHVSELTATKGEITPTNVIQQNGKPALATDKDLSSLAVAAPVNKETWIKLEFKESKFFNQIIIYRYFYTNWYDAKKTDCWADKSKFRTCQDADSEVEIEVYLGDTLQGGCGTLDLTYQLEQENQIYTFTCWLEGDMVKLSRNASNLGNIAVAEIVVTAYPQCKIIICVFRLLIYLSVATTAIGCN